MKYDSECFQRPARRLEWHQEEIITRRGHFRSREPAKERERERNEIFSLFSFLFSPFLSFYL